MVRRAAIWLFAALLLGGCQDELLKQDEERTGNLGSAQRASSPADTFTQLAAEYLRMGNYPAALRKAKKAVARDASSPSAHLVLGLVYEALGEIGQAQTTYRRARELAPRDPYVLNASGRLLCTLEEYDKSLVMFGRALQNPLYETPWVASTNAGICARKAGKAELAETYFLKALEKNKAYPPALAQMAQVRFDQGKYLSTRAYIQRYREVAKPTAELLYLSILAERKLGNRDQERSDELLLMSEYPDSEQARKLAK